MLRTKLVMMACNVRFCRSTSPSHWGWYVVVRVFLRPIILYTSCMRRLSKFQPWSECMTVGDPNLANNLETRMLATVLAFWSLVAKASHYLAKLSITKRICLLPVAVSCNGPI